MAKPFVSHDGPDANGVRAEVWVQVGTGVVTKVEDSGRKNVQVQIKAEHLERPLHGWLDKNDPLYPTVLDAQQTGRVVGYRIESQRRSGVDRTIPITDLRETMDRAKENCLNILAGIDDTLSGEAVTNPAEDPHAGGRLPATSPRPSTASPTDLAGTAGLSVDRALAGLAAARAAGLPPGVIDAAVALALAAGANTRQVTTAGVTDTPASQPEIRLPRAHEAAPYVEFNSDGRINLGSYAVQAAFSAEQVAYDLIHEQSTRTARRTGGNPEPVDLSQAAELGRVLLTLADRVQVGAYGGGRVDRMAASHTRARTLVYDAVTRRHPVPFGATDPAARDKWVTAVVDEAVERFRHLAEIAHTVPSFDPADQSDTPPDQSDTPADPVDQSADPADQSDTPVDTADQSAPPADPPADQPADTADQPVTQPELVAPDAGSTAAPPRGDAVPPADPKGTGGEPRRALVEGDDGFVPPSAETRDRFARLAAAAGFTASPTSPIVAYLHSKFGVNLTRKVHGPDLDRLVTWYEQQGERGVELFHRHVLAAAGHNQAA